MALSKIDVANMLTGVTPVANGGTALSSGFNNGKLLQVQSNTFTASISTSSTSFEATSIFDQITPSATDSKILIWIDGGRGSFGGGTAEGQVKLYRQINSGGFSALRNMHLEMVHESGGYGKPTVAFNYIDTSHNTTSAIDYKIYIKTNANTWTLNSGSSQIGILLMEMAA